MDEPKKSLGQHWLEDAASLKHIADAASLKPGETVLEIGPGKGSLTRELLSRGVKVIAVEKDEALAANLKSKHLDNLVIIEGDILKFDFSFLPVGYKIVANIPYYLTAHLLRLLTEVKNKPSIAVLLMQKEVAGRVCAHPRNMSLLSVSTQLSYDPSLGKVVEAEKFIPPPKVDSQVLILKSREEALFIDLDSSEFFRVVKAGFGEKRKKLRSSLAGGLGLSKEEADGLLSSAGINGDLRAQNLSLEEWHSLAVAYHSTK